MERLKQHYELLRLKPGAKLNEIKQAYVLAERKLHDDRLADDPLVRHRAQEHLRKINEAYMKIMDAYQEVQASLMDGKIHIEPKPTAETPGGIAAVEPEDNEERDSSSEQKSNVIPMDMSRTVVGVGKQLGGGMTGAAPLSESGNSPDDVSEHTEEKGAPNSIPPENDEAGISDPADLLRKESYLLFSIVVLVLFIMVVTWIRTVRKSPAPDAAVKITAPMETVSPSRETSEPMGTVSKSSVRQSTTASPPVRQPAAGDTVDVGVVMHDAEQGNAKAQALLGYMYVAGKGVRKDPAAAVKWFRTAADQGNAEAEDWLGYLYEMGTGVSRNYPEAVRWYRLAAEQGNADAQKNLGRMYAKGKGVAKSPYEAIKWLRKAATQGNQEAQTALEIWQEE